MRLTIPPAPRLASALTAAVLSVLGSVVSGVPGFVRPAAASENGVVPLWEQTAVLHKSGGGQIGYGHAQIALGPVQIGTQPFLALSRTWNAQLKLALLERGAHRTALTLGAYLLPAAAEARTVGELHRTGFANPYTPMRLFPVAVAHTWALAERLHVHSALTTLLQHADDPRERVTSLGAATMIEARTGNHWSARLHAGTWGIGVETQAHVALSFAFRSEHLMLAAGYGRQASASGESRGLLLVDGALLFP